LTEHDDVITPLLRGAPRLGLALGPAPARAGPGQDLHETRERTTLRLASRGLVTPAALLYATD